MGYQTRKLLRRAGNGVTDMEMSLSAQDEAFRNEVRAFLDAKLTAEIKAEMARTSGVFAEGPLAQHWHRILYEQGWIAPAWPVEYGGTGWSIVQRYIWDTEATAAGAPSLPAMGLQMCGPVLMEFGTPEQKEFFLPRILSGEHYWCQGYSEPGSGSDLASLQCKGVREGDDYIINGTKIWTTHAQFANWIFCLIRTNSELKPQAGISFILIDLASPGIEIRPIISIGGDHEVNQIFFDNVRVPAALLVGGENNGWTVAKYLLEFERGGAYAGRLRALLSKVRAMAAIEQADGQPLIRDPDFARKLSELEMAIEAVDMTEKRVISALSVGSNPGSVTSSILKLLGTETTQEVTELAIETIGYYGLPDYQQTHGRGDNIMPGSQHAVPVMAKYLNTRAATIYGGSSEIQRNILARAALGL